MGGSRVFALGTRWGSIAYCCFYFKLAGWQLEGHRDCQLACFEPGFIATGLPPVALSEPESAPFLNKSKEISVGENFISKWKDRGVKRVGGYPLRVPDIEMGAGWIPRLKSAILNAFGEVTKEKCQKLCTTEFKRRLEACVPPVVKSLGSRLK